MSDYAIDVVPEDEGEPRPLVPTGSWKFSMTGGSKVTPEQDAILGRPAPPELIKQRPDGLYYIEQVHFRATLNNAFGRGGWYWDMQGDPHVTKSKKWRSVNGKRELVEVIDVWLWGAIFVWNAAGVAQNIGMGFGEAEYFPHQNPATALESAKSDSITRICKDLGVFAELWMKGKPEQMVRERGGGVVEVGDREPAEAQPEQKSCPKCNGRIFPSQYKAGQWYCNKNRGGCGWQGQPGDRAIAPDPATAVAEKEGQRRAGEAKRDDPDPALVSRVLQDFDLLRQYENTEIAKLRVRRQKGELTATEAALLDNRESQEQLWMEKGKLTTWRESDVAREYVMRHSNNTGYKAIQQRILQRIEERKAQGEEATDLPFE